MLIKEQVAGKVVRVWDAPEQSGGLGLFLCSTIAVGKGMAGTWLIDAEAGDVLLFDKMIEVVDPERAASELRAFQQAQDRDQIEAVIKDVENAQEEFKGTIVLHVSFKGSLAKTKALTKPERDTVMKSDVDPGKLKGGKVLFVSEEYDAIETFKAQRRQEFANLGIPFPLGDSMYLIRIGNIPAADALGKRTIREMENLVASLKAVYPKQITPEAVKLGSIYNAGDYKNVDALDSLFQFSMKWMHFGVPDVLKEIDAEIWEQERIRTAEVWKQAKEEGMLLLRRMMTEMVSRLVLAVTPNGDGSRKRFYGTAVTDLVDFFEVFENRNLAGDDELKAVVAKMKEVVADKPVEAFKSDEAFRASVVKAGAEIQGQLQAMLIDAEERVIRFSE